MTGHLSFRIKNSAVSRRNREAGTIKKGDIIELKLNQIKACQPAIGKDQVFYKVGRFDGVNWVPDGEEPVRGRTFSDDEKLFDDVAYANGQKVDQAKIFRLENSAPGNPDSYLVIDEQRQIVAPGAVPNTMKTVVIGPDGNNYLTDGHHTLNTFSTIQRGGTNHFSLNLVVEANHSQLKDKNDNNSSMDEFWKKMANNGNAWLKVLRKNKPGYRYLKGVNGRKDQYRIKSIDLQSFEGQLPEKMTPSSFRNDPYRAIMNFTRGIAWDAPEGTDAEGLPFLEFYWSEEIQSAINEGKKDLDVHTDESNYNLSDLNSYVSAVKAISNWITGLPEEEIIGTSGFTARQMGQRSELDEDELNELINSGKTLKASSSDEQDAFDVPRFGKLGYAWAQRHPSAQSKRRSSGRDLVTDFTTGVDAVGINATADRSLSGKTECLLIRSGADISTMLPDLRTDECLNQGSEHLRIPAAHGETLI